MGRVKAFYLRDEDLYEKLHYIARDLGYRSFSDMMNDIFKEIVSTYELLMADKTLREKHLAKQKIVKSSIFKKIFSRFA